MKSLVTGGCGFIGSHLVDGLLERGDEVVVLDNFSTGRPQNLAHQKDNPNLTVHQVDISEYGILEPYFQGIDRVFHIAALADIVPSIQNPISYHRSNVDGTINVLEASRKANIKHLVYAASSSCFGIPDAYPTPEDADIRPEYPYATTKWIGEQYVLNWHKVYNLPVTSLRFFNVYGPRSRTSGTYGAVFGVFLAQKLNGQPYTVVGDGTQTRDFTYVTDIARACIMASESEAAIGEVMNVGSGNHYSVNRLVELLGGDKTFIPKRPGEPDCTFADTTKIRNLLGWEPLMTFEQGVQTMLDHIDYWREAPLWTPDKIAEATKDWFKYLG
ncbi:MAG: SDR family oxidoreductase [Bacteroidota bacterium]